MTDSKDEDDPSHGNTEIPSSILILDLPHRKECQSVFSLSVLVRM